MSLTGGGGRFDGSKHKRLHGKFAPDGGRKKKLAEALDRARASTSSTAKRSTPSAGELAERPAPHRSTHHTLPGAVGPGQELANHLPSTKASLKAYQTGRAEDHKTAAEAHRKDARRAAEDGQSGSQETHEAIAARHDAHAAAGGSSRKPDEHDGFSASEYHGYTSDEVQSKDRAINRAHALSQTANASGKAEDHLAAAKAFGHSAFEGKAEHRVAEHEAKAGAATASTAAIKASDHAHDTQSPPAHAEAERLHGQARAAHAAAGNPAAASVHEGLAAHHAGAKIVTSGNVGRIMDRNKDTEAIYRHPETGAWDASRRPIHEGYYKSTTEGVPKAVGEGPTVHMTGGGPAAGKTVGLLNNPKAGIPGRDRASHVNADEAKEHIPEYEAAKQAVKKAQLENRDPDMRGASFVHEESSAMSKEATNRALRAGHDVVLDTTGDSGIDNLHKKVEQMRAAGAKRVVAHYATVDLDEALKREDSRAKKSGRKVNPEFLRQVHQSINQTIGEAAARGTFDELHVWDTSGPHGEAPVHVMSHTREGGLKIHDQAAYDRFVKRGKVA